MRLRIHHALFMGFAGTIAAVVLLLAFLVGNRVRAEMRDTFESEMGRQLNLTGVILSRVQPDGLQAAVDSVAREMGHRVSVIALDGEVLADSEVAPADLAGVDNHATRPEVRQALSGTRGFATRTSATVNDPFLYGAQFAEVGGQEIVLRIAAPLDRIDVAVERLRGRIILTGVVAMVPALVLAWILALLLASPMAKLADQARLLAAGNLELRVPTGRRVAELENLASAFNRLGEELQGRMTELAGERDEIQALIDSLDQGLLALDPDARFVRWNRTAVQLLALPEGLRPFTPATALVRHEGLREVLLAAAEGREVTQEVHLHDRELVVTTHPLSGGGGAAGILDVSEIRRLEQVRKDFVANASHELKTPLTALRGYAETLLEEDPGAEIRRTFLTSILNNTVRLQNLVDDLLDLSRLDSGGWVADTRQLEVGRIAREAFDPFRDEAEAGNRSFEVEGSAQAVADPAGLIQVFRNLYENALRHTDPGGSVQVVIREEPETVHVAVSDDGEGIPQKSLPRIFERFYRADSSRDRDQGGTGLGLAIVRHLVQSMGGTVWAESELSGGTTVNFTLPRHVSDEQ
jgi:signal transduction histidine kinase